MSGNDRAFPLPVDETAILYELARILHRPYRAVAGKSVPLLQTIPSQPDDLLWRALDAKEFQPQLFSQEVYADVVPRLARLSEEAPLQLYAATLCMHAYAAGYHWNAANQEDRHVLLGFAVGAACEIAPSATLALASFIAWMRHRDDHASTNPFVTLQPSPTPDGIGGSSHVAA